MIYNGDYLDNKIYGTSVNNKIKVTTEDDANFLLCQISVSYNGINWTHPFEVPFFSNNAELYFENYIHSIIIQNLKEFTVSKDAISLTSFDIASVQIVLKEMKQSDLLEELELNFYMSLGNFDTLDYTEIQTGTQLLLPTNNSNFITEKAIVSFSFFSLATPNKLFIKTYNDALEFPLAVAPPNLLLHTIFIPVKLAISLNNNLFNFSLAFEDNRVMQLHEFTFSNIGPDHATIIYQNDYGTLSAIEFIGEQINMEDFQIKNTRSSKNSIFLENTTDIAFNSLRQLNTGQILDESKYKMLLELIRSFNTYYLLERPTKIILKGNHKISPYFTNRNFSNELLTFKISENDQLHYRGF